MNQLKRIYKLIVVNIVAFICLLFSPNLVIADTIIYGMNAYGSMDVVEINLGLGTHQITGEAAFQNQAIDQDPETGYIYYFEWTDSGDEFAYWDPATATNTIVRAYNPAPQLYAKQMAFSPDGTLYILDNDDGLYTIDKHTGDLTFLGYVSGLETGEWSRTGDFAFDPDGRLYVATYQRLYEVDLDTLLATELYSNMLQGQEVWSGLAYCNGILYASNIKLPIEISDIYSIDPATGTVNRLLTTQIVLNDLSSCPSSLQNNTPPVLDPIGDQTISEGEVLEFTLTALDSDGDALTYAASDLPPGSILNPTTGTFIWTPGASDNGEHTILFRVTDDGTPFRSDTEQIRITVNTPSTPGTITLEGEGDTEDTMLISGSYSTSNFGSSDNLYIGSAGISLRSLLKWDLSAIPPGSTIISAEMSLYSYQNHSGGGITINAHRMLQPWVEGSRVNQAGQQDNPPSATWGDYGNGGVWDEPGAGGTADRDSSILSSTTNSGTGWYSWSLTSAIQHWMDGDWDNDGLILVSDNEGANNLKIFRTSEYADVSLRPKLVIEYQELPVENRPPVLNPMEPMIVDEGDLIEFTVTASDVDGDALTYSASDLPAGALFNPETQTFSWTPGPGDLGLHVVQFQVTDDGIPFLSDSGQINITVNPQSTSVTITLEGSGDTEDTMLIGGSYSSSNFGASNNLYIGSAGFALRGLLKWDLSVIPPGSTIVSAEMSLYSYQNYSGGGITINAHRMLQPWVEGSQVDQAGQQDSPPSATWVDYGNSGLWDEPGAGGTADRDSSILSSTTNSGTGWYSWSLTSTIQHWVDGDWDNNGLVLLSDDESSNNLKIFRTSEYTNASFRPSLTIEYIQP
ncbi:MAG: DNRLRE domain-containing protein [Gammaproteobacteria bacterium]|nr:DNRLRE domain-containing protein [Gammaproteobacteria bacterium]